MTTTGSIPIGQPRQRSIVRWLRARRGPDPTFTRLFARFALTGLIAVGALAVVAFVIVRASATSGAISQAKSLGELAGRGIAEPLVTPGVLRGDPADLHRLDVAVRRRILAGGQIVRVKIWDARGGWSTPMRPA